jgi:RNA polymerase sigma-70 factor (ECF subfamily)
MQRDSGEFVSLLTGVQTTLYAYLLSLVPNRQQAEDLLQETNLTIWRKAEQFEAGTSFVAWSCKIAYFHVLAHRRRSGRERTMFSEELLDFLAERQAERAEAISHRGDALRRCIEQLPANQREMLDGRYGPGGSVARLAEQTGRPAGSISVSLFRIRTALLDCVRARMAEEPA